MFGAAINLNDYGKNKRNYIELHYYATIQNLGGQLPKRGEHVRILKFG